MEYGVFNVAINSYIDECNVQEKGEKNAKYKRILF